MKSNRYVAVYNEFAPLNVLRLVYSGANNIYYPRGTSNRWFFFTKEEVVDLHRRLTKLRTET